MIGCKPRPSATDLKSELDPKALKLIPSSELVKILESNQLSCPKEPQQQLIKLLATGKNWHNLPTDLYFHVAATNPKDMKTWTGLSIRAQYSEGAKIPTNYPGLPYLESMEFLECFKHITYFQVFGVSMYGGGLGMIPELSEVRQLFVSHSWLDDLGGIGSMTKLKILTIDTANISNSSELIKLIFLEKLSIVDSPKLQDITGIGALPELRELYLERNSITDVGPLSKTPSLEVLTLDRNRIRTLDNLKSMPSLAKLRAFNNCISFPKDLSQMPQLKELDLSYNDISILPANIQSPNLVSLKISSNRIADISPLYSWRMPALTLLELDEANAKALDQRKLKLAMPNAKIKFTPITKPGEPSSGVTNDVAWGDFVYNPTEDLKIHREFCQSKP